MALEPPFSKRHGFNRGKDVTIRDDAPENLRYFVVQTTLDLGWSPVAFAMFCAGRCAWLRMRETSGVEKSEMKSDR